MHGNVVIALILVAFRNPPSPAPPHYASHDCRAWSSILEAREAAVTEALVLGGL